MLFGQAQMLQILVLLVDAFVTDCPYHDRKEGQNNSDEFDYHADILRKSNRL